MVCESMGISQSFHLRCNSIEMTMFALNMRRARRSSKVTNKKLKFSVAPFFLLNNDRVIPNGSEGSPQPEFASPFFQHCYKNKCKQALQHFFLLYPGQQ